MPPADPTSYRVIRFLNISEAVLDRSTRDLCERMRTPDSQTTVHRLLNFEAPLTVGRAKSLTKAAADGLRLPWLPLWIHLSDDRIEPDSEFTEFELASFWAPDPRRVNAIAALLRKHQRGSPLIIWFGRGLPFPFFPPHLVASAIRNWASQYGARAFQVSRAELRLSRLHNVQVMEGCEIGAQKIVVPSYRQEFETMLLRRHPYDGLSPSQVYEIIESLRHDCLDHGIIPVFINRRSCTAELGAHFDRFQSVVTVGNQLLMRQPLRWAGRLWYERSNDPTLNAHIDVEVRRLNELLQHREHDMTPAAVAEQLERYLR